jgi:hypothetical protein
MLPAWIQNVTDSKYLYKFLPWVAKGYFLPKYDLFVGAELSNFIFATEYSRASSV